MTFKESSGYIDGKKKKQVSCTVICKVEDPNFVRYVDILIRGGEKIPLLIQAKFAIPNVSIVQEEFKFGIISFNEKSNQTLTFQNKSNLSARIIINFNTTNLKDFKVSKLHYIFIFLDLVVIQI